MRLFHSVLLPGKTPPLSSHRHCPDARAHTIRKEIENREKQLNKKKEERDCHGKCIWRSGRSVHTLLLERDFCLFSSNADLTRSFSIVIRSTRISQKWLGTKRARSTQLNMFRIRIGRRRRCARENERMKDCSFNTHTVTDTYTQQRWMKIERWASVEHMQK